MGVHKVMQIMKDTIFTVNFIIVATLCFAQAFDITIVDNKIEKGLDSSLCLIGKIHCLTLDFVFSHLSDCHNNPISVSVLDGNYNFTLNSTVTGNLFKNCPAISIAGVSADHTSIVCGMDAGFTFQNVLQVNIMNITFANCGSLRNSMSANLTINSTLLLSTALYFVYCKDVQIVNVTVQNSNSTGVVMYNTYGELLVEGSTFIGNGYKNDSLPSNGGFYIEFVHCNTHRADDNCIQQNNSYANYYLKSNNFFFNHAMKKIEGASFDIPNYHSFVHGGGLSITFKGNASNNSILIDSCDFFGNSASQGGGLLVEFEDYSKNNMMIINNSHFSENWVIADAKHSYEASGGGVRVGFVIFEQKSVEYNSLLFENCVFTGNTALRGGGLGMYMPSEPNVVNATNSINFRNCYWSRNKGLLGSAIYLYYWHTHPAGVKMQVKFSACKIYDNKYNESIKLSTVQQELNLFNTGALYTNGIPIEFEESVELCGNIGSALAIFDTIAKFSDSCNASFINNTAWMGGAIAMFGASQLWINPYTIFLFKNNRAKFKGGALYALQANGFDLLPGENCFLQYNSQFKSSPNKWETKFTFNNNHAPTGSSILVTTLLSCEWAASFEDINLTALNTSSWSHFSFIPLDSNTIATEVSKATLEMNMSIPKQISLAKFSKPPIRSSWLMSNNQSVKVPWWVSGKIQDSKAYTTIVTDSSHIMSAKLPVVPVQCPPGYYLDKNQTCQCCYQHKRRQLDGILSCDSETFTAKIRRGYWAGYHLSTEHPTPSDFNLVTGQCPRHYCGVKDREASLPNTTNITLLNELFCSSVNRNGTLCGMCSDGYSVAINSMFFDCVNCSDWLSQHGWLIYILTEYIPSTLLFCLILFFDINLHSGTSSVILYFQIFYLLNIYSDGIVDPPSHSEGILKGITFVYNVWNLDFFGILLPPYCINNNYNTMDIFLIKYISGFYPFLLFLLFIVLINLVYVKCEQLKNIARKIREGLMRFKIKINRSGRTENGLATLWTLVFTKLAVISGLILSQETLRGSEYSGITLKVVWLNGNLPYNDKRHQHYMIPAVIVLVFFVFIPAISLLCYPLVPQTMRRIHEKTGFNFDQYRLYKFVSIRLQKLFLSRPIKLLIDSFQGSCKVGYEFYASLLFIYRISIVFVFSFTIQADSIFYITVVSLIFIIITAISMPYKDHRHNIVTILCLSNIVFINILSFSNLYYTKTHSNRDLQPWLWLQLVMVLLPLVFFVVFAVYRSWQKLKKFWKQVPVDENDYEPVNASEGELEGGLEGSMMCDVTESTDNGHQASLHLPPASGSIQNHEGTPGDNNSKSNMNPIANYGSCENQQNTSDN